MATVAANAPITIKEALRLQSIGINHQFRFTNVTMESDKFICVRETSPQNSVVIIDMSMPMQPWRWQITADSALMNPISKILAFKAQLPGTTQDHLQIFNIEMKAKMKSHQMPEPVVFWKWITPKKLGLVTHTSVYHWSLEGDSEPVKMFDRLGYVYNKQQILNYKCDPTEKWLVLIVIVPGSPEIPKLLKGNMQLFSVDQQRSQALEAHAASFATLKVPGNENPSILISVATRSSNAGQVTSKLHVAELGAQPGKPSFTKKQADLFFPPDFADDFPVSMQISHKYGLIYVITKLGLLFVYDLETATAVYRNRISPDPIFLACEATSGGGFYAVNRRGIVLLATVNESTIVPFVSGQKNKQELAVSLAKRGTWSGSGSASSVIKIAAIGNDKQSDPSNSSSVQWSQQCRHFEFSEILLATKNFDESLVIGRGGFGKVYRGTIFNGSTTVIAAIKRLDSSSNQGAPEFWAEVEMLSKLRHCHLVSLFGYCNHEKEMVLVYEYMPNGTLEDHLHKLGTPLSWLQRLKICIGAGRGLHYLHTGTGIDVGVIHRDVKTSNILLQESWAAKISDFGLSKIGPTNQPMTHVNTVVKGTFGYIDPDYYATGNLTRKSDVYAFGVVLLEVLCRKRAIFNIDGEALNLANWAQESIKEGSLKNIIDFDIRGQVSPKCSKEFIRIAERCLHSSPKKRSTMAEVLSSLESILSLQEKFNNSVQPAGRTILDRMISMLPFPSNGEKTDISSSS